MLEEKLQEYAVEYKVSVNLKTFISNNVAKLVPHKMTGSKKTTNRNSTCKSNIESPLEATATTSFVILQAASIKIN
ncbi:hypothetical protein HK100_006891 [Physocladia obscura]|uniref:Uncharacterized protein n=1 Tax=Physocladia obscura TaxID=109957 RepID=A0AAD5XB43_9FUNG|nr:hypothetical protein HK100_006891 [Physocladia obscura]